MDRPKKTFWGVARTTASGRHTGVAGGTTADGRTTAGGRHSSKGRRPRRYKLRAKGAILFILVMAVATATSMTAIQFVKKTMIEAKLATNLAEKTKAFYCAKTAFNAALTLVSAIPEKILYDGGTTGFSLIGSELPIPIKIGDCSMTFRVDAEDGKINVNDLVNLEANELKGAADTVFQTTKDRLEALFLLLNIDPELVEALIDYIDADSAPLPSGAEELDYAEMKPPRRIKNYALFSIKEVLAVKGFTYKLLMESRKPENWDETHSLDFATDEEKVMLTDRDWFLINNITALPVREQKTNPKININAAGYYVLKAVAPDVFADEQGIKEFERIRDDEGGYIKELSKLKKSVYFQQKSGTDDVEYYQYLENSFATKGRYFRLTAEGSFGDNSVTAAKIDAVLDKDKKKLLWYKEY